VNEELTAYLTQAWAYPWVRAVLVLLASLVLAWIVDRLFRKVLRRLTARTGTDIDDKLIQILRRPVFYSVVLVGLHATTKILELDPSVREWIASLLATAAIVIWSGAGLRACSTILDALSRLSQRVGWLDSRTLPLFDNLARLLIVGAAAYFLMVAWGINVTAWLASAGILGLAFGFAAKDTLANLFGGLFVIADAPYKIGDFINLDTGERGRVIKIGLRSTRLLTRDDVEITLPNAVIANSKIVNESGGPWEQTRVAVKVGVAYGSDVDQVRALLMEAALSVQHVMPDPEPRIRFIEMGDSALIFRVMVWIDEPVSRGRVLDGLNTAIYKALNAAEVAIPFPQRDVHIYQSPPAS
jgi:small-conductance mechanosensitive channel